MEGLPDKGGPSLRSGRRRPARRYLNPLRHIKAGAAELVQFATMNRNQNHAVRQAPITSPMPSYSARNLAEMSDRLGLPVAPAAWPTGVSLLAQLVDACQRCDATEVCDDWLARAPGSIDAPPPFCPNAEALKRAKS